MEEKTEKNIDSDNTSNNKSNYLSKNEESMDEELEPLKKEVENSNNLKTNSNQDNVKEERDNTVLPITQINDDLKKKDNLINSDLNKVAASKKEINDDLKKKEDLVKSELDKVAVSIKENNDDVKNKEDLVKSEVNNVAVSKKENNDDVKNKEDLVKSEVNKLADSIKENNDTKLENDNSDNKKITTENSNQNIKPIKDEKPKPKPKKEIPIEKKPFNEFIIDHLIPEIKNEFKNRGKEIGFISIEKTNRPISEDICWVIYCEVLETCNFWLSFEKDDITSPKSFSLCKNYEKPSIIESFLIDEKKITLKLIISRILQRLNGQKLIGAN